EGDEEDIIRLGHALAEQLCLHHGCMESCPAELLDSEPDGLSVHIDNVISWPCPDTLSKEKIGDIEGSWADRFPPPQRRKVYCGWEGEGESEGAPSVSMASEEALLHVPVDITFDIDSVGGYATSLAVARNGIRWNPVPPPVSNIQSSLHLTSL